jgi:prevent-host-death family protein
MTTHLVTTLKRQATDLIEEVNKTKTPMLITEYGKPAVYLVDPVTFAATQEKIAILEAIARGEKDIQASHVLSHAAVRKNFKKWLE